MIRKIEKYSEHNKKLYRDHTIHKERALKKAFEDLRKRKIIEQEIRSQLQITKKVIEHAKHLKDSHSGLHLLSYSKTLQENLFHQKKIIKKITKENFDSLKKLVHIEKNMSKMGDSFIKNLEKHLSKEFKKIYKIIKDHKLENKKDQKLNIDLLNEEKNKRVLKELIKRLDHLIKYKMILSEFTILIPKREKGHHKIFTKIEKELSEIDLSKNLETYHLIKHLYGDYIFFAF